jgi:hemerythrin HHE cation binding domain-containing protein
MAAEEADRTVAWSRQLVQAHGALRRQIKALQASLDVAPAGGGLQAHCLAFCSALSVHHEGEDGGMFAELLRVRPDLRDVVQKLAEDHQMIAGILATVRDLAHEAPGVTPERREVIRREFGGLAAIMESHFGYEERAISDAIDDQVQDTIGDSGVYMPPGFGYVRGQ